MRRIGLLAETALIAGKAQIVGKVESMFVANRIDPRAQALEIWRDAEDIVSMRWDAFLNAEPETRRWAFVSYVAALDAEEAAAAELASFSLGIAA